MAWVTASQPQFMPPLFMLEQYCKMTFAKSELARWASHRVIIEYAMYSLLKHNFGVVDRTDMSNIVFEINKNTAKEILKNHDKD